MTNKHEQLDINRMLEGNGAIYELWFQLTRAVVGQLVWGRIKEDSQPERLRIVMEQELKATYD